MTDPRDLVKLLRDLADQVERGTAQGRSVREEHEPRFREHFYEDPRLDSYVTRVPTGSRYVVEVETMVDVTWRRCDYCGYYHPQGVECPRLARRLL